MDSLLNNQEEINDLELNMMNIEEEQEINQEEVWTVIDEYFRKKGLVGQQLDSFDEFIRTTIQETIDDAGEIVVVPENQFVHGVDLEKVQCLIK
jgi:DNA-directed RNA polymerase II subunit RPB2